MDITKIKMLQSTLSWLNETFVPSVGMKPLEDLPYGARANSKTCVIARALSTNAPISTGYWSVTSSEIELVTDSGIERWDVPTEIGTFINMFDDGDFPDYEERSN